MTSTGFTQELDYAASLHAAGGSDGEHPFDIARAARALRAETGFAPHDPLAHGALGVVVRRRHVRMIDERPQMLALLEDFAAFSGEGALVQFAFGQKRLRVVLHEQRFASERSPLQRPVPNAGVPPQHPCRQDVKLFADITQSTARFADGRKVALQMRPAKLAKTVEEVVAAPAVGHQHAGKPIQQRARRFLAAPLACTINAAAVPQHSVHSHPLARFPRRHPVSSACAIACPRICSMTSR